MSKSRGAGGAYYWAEAMETKHESSKRDRRRNFMRTPKYYRLLTRLAPNGLSQIFVCDCARGFTEQYKTVSLFTERDYFRSSRRALRRAEPAPPNGRSKSAGANHLNNNAC